MPNRRNSQPDILIFKGKYATQYFPAATPEQRATAFYRVLKARYDEGWFYEPEISNLTLRADDAALLVLTDEQLAALPETSRKTLTAKIAAIRATQEREQREFEAERIWFEDLQRLVNMPEADAIKEPGRDTRRGVSRLEELAEAHDGYEYEEYDYEYFG
jgi:hypothetical protein